MNKKNATKRKRKKKKEKKQGNQWGFYVPMICITHLASPNKYVYIFLHFGFLHQGTLF